MTVVRPVSQIVYADFQFSGGLSSCDDAMIEWSREELGKDRDDVEPHSKIGVKVRRLTNPVSLRGDQRLGFGQPSQLAGKWN